MANPQATPASTFHYILSNQMPRAMAWVRGGSMNPAISGLAKFYETPYQGILVEAEFFNLPGVNQPGSSGFFAMHIHQNPDDFHTQPSGNAGTMIACGEIRTS